MAAVNLYQLDDDSLLNETRALVAEERRITTEILRFLGEVQRRRLYALRGYASMHEFATQYLGYSDAKAQRRLAAIAVLKEIPEMEKKIEAGEISLSNVAMAQKFFKAEAKSSNALSVEEKKEVLEKLEGKSTRETERTLVSMSSQPESFLRPDQVRHVSEKYVEIRFVADEGLMEVLEEVKGLLAHRNPNLSMAELVREMAKMSLEKLQPKKPSQVPAQKAEPKKSGAGVDAKGGGGAEAKRSRHIPAHIKKTVYHRDGGRCSYRDEKSGRVCGSKFGLEYNHIVPFGKGGATTVENVNLVCRQHNAALAIRDYGMEKMAGFFESGMPPRQG